MTKNGKKTFDYLKFLSKIKFKRCTIADISYNCEKETKSEKRSQISIALKKENEKVKKLIIIKDVNMILMHENMMKLMNFIDFI